MTNLDEHVTPEKNIKIFVRILPMEKPCASCVRIDTDRKKIFVRCLQELQPNRIAINKHPSYWCFRTDGIFLDASQEEVYRVSSKDLVSKILNGTDCVVIGHGQTGSGKSFTLSGLRNNWEHRGLVSRILYDLFLERSNRKRTNKIQYRVSFVELHGKDARDLLLFETENRIRINDRDPFKDVSVVHVENEEQALRKIFEGEAGRSIVKGSTYLDSHLASSVITVHSNNVSLIASGCVVTTAKMHFVEMAGIGSAGKSGCGKTAFDVGTANLAKSELEQFFSHFRGAQSVPYNAIRFNNLLKILGADFPVSSVIRFISHIRVAKEDLEVTLSTLRFTGNIGGSKPVKAKTNLKYREDQLVQRLRTEVETLKKELTINELFLNQEASINISKLRVEQIDRSVLDYLNGTVTDLTLLTASQAQQLLKSIKNLYDRLMVKEVEVQRLIETYENISRDMVDAGVSTRLSKESAFSDESRTRARKNSSCSESLSEIEEKRETKREEVGNIVKTAIGMTLGPYKREEEHDKDSAFEADQRPDDRNILMLRQLFERFLKDEGQYGRIKERLDKNVRTLATVQQRFSAWIDKYFQVKSTLENARDRLDKHRQIRYAMEPESDGGEEMAPETETVIDRDIACYRKVLVNLEEEVAQARNEIRDLFKEQLEMRSRLKSGFREYCKEMDALPIYSDGSMKLLLDPVEKELLEPTRRKFNQFQHAMMRKFEEKERIKKPRCDDT